MNVRVTPNRDGRASGECFGGGIGRLVKGRVAEAKGLSNEPFLNAAATTMLTARIMKPVGSTGPRLEKHQENYRFVRAMIAFRGAHPILSKEEFHTTSEMQWFDPQQGMPDWTNPKCKQIACLIHENGQDGLYLMFNAGTEETHFGLPRLQEGYCWNLFGGHVTRNAAGTPPPRARKLAWTISPRIAWKLAPLRFLRREKQKSASGADPECQHRAAETHLSQEGTGE